SCSDSMCNIHSGFLSIGLYPLDDSVLRYKINGKISEKKGGVLIIAEFDFSPCPLGYTDENGEFSIFNVPAGDYSVKAYVKDKNYSAELVTVADKDIDGVELDLIETPLSTLSGSVNIVNAPGGSKTSIVLIPASTFIESFSKGILAPGLRAPDYGIEPNVSGNYTITGIPDGKYYVLAAFENDLLVRDPDPNIAGTQILKVTFPADGPVYDISIGNFKVTEAIPIIFPGAEGPELISEPPLFQWERDASATKYIVNVYTAQGTVQWTKEVPKTDDAVMSVQYDGPALKGFYQWIVVSYKNTAPISMSEDLLGIFYTNMQY
ncbi:MAG TPA: carboxypeptidase-like regulatory domain-containing protein, partial [bacterium]|nr:carboxypeptidase-like regulatory domain-containing protein [bacterium]